MAHYPSIKKIMCRGQQKVCAKGPDLTHVSVSLCDEDTLFTISGY